MELFPGVSHEHLLRVARRIVGPDEAEDVVQTAYLKAHQAHGTFRAECKPATWLHRITVRCAIDARRKRNRQPEEALPVDHNELRYDDRHRPIDDLIQQAEVRLQALPAKHRDVLRALVLWRTTKATAAALGISTSAVKTRIWRARLALGRST